MKTIIIILTAALILIQVAPVVGHEGHDHAGQKKEASTPGGSWFTVNSASEAFEAVLRYFPIKPNEETAMQLFLSDFETNAAIDTAQLTVTCLDDKNVIIEVHYIEPGIYELHATFPEEKEYTLAANIISHNEADLMVLGSIEVGRELPKVEKEKTSGFGWNSVFLIVVGLISGALLMFLFSRNKPAGSGTIATITVIILLLIPGNFIKIALAHGDEDHGDKKEETVRNSDLANDEMLILKETQFMFSMLTEYADKTNYYTVLKLYGKIMSSLNGEARIIASQNGAIASIYVNIGEKVSKGQVLAIIEQNLSASELIQIQNEKNNAIAEYENAKKDYDRLKSLEDVIAGKDLLAAKIRLENATNNKKIYDNLSGRMLTLSSPIAGVMDNFNLAIGKQVAQGDRLFTIFNIKLLKVEAQIFDQDLHKLNHPDTATIGSQFTFSVECIQEEEHFSEFARLISFGKSVNPINQSSQVILELDNKNELFKPGQFANVEIKAKNNLKQIVVPSSAVSEINGKPVVFVHSAPEIFKVIFVQTGQSNSSQTVILKGLEENQRVIVDGAYQVKSIYLNQ
ncbi:MAG: efflux RND transporter periplasmic adaptor subunit [Bacteroidetes bacterium]|nr:efflux RND transporter periplasmic adaptor subunit [Bacteroidota bacterium]